MTESELQPDFRELAELVRKALDAEAREASLVNERAGRAWLNAHIASSVARSALNRVLTPRVAWTLLARAGVTQLHR